MSCSSRVSGLLVSATEFKSSDYRRHGRRGAPRGAGRARGGVPGFRRTGSHCGIAARRRPPTSCVPGWTRLDTNDPINIQYTSGTTGSPEGCDAVAPQHPQQRVLRHRPDQLRTGRPVVHPGAVLSLLRHGDGQPGVHHPRRHDGDPGPRLRSRRHPGRGRTGALYSAVRGADHVHRDARTPRLWPPATCRRCEPASWRDRPVRSR